MPKHRHRSRRRLLVLSHVLPFPRTGGQHQRVFYTLQAARSRFHVSFATIEGPEAAPLRKELLELCDEVVFLPSAYRRTIASRVFHGVAGSVYSAATGLKRSNYDIGRVEFSPRRIGSIFDDATFDCVLFEYWHAAASVRVFQQMHIPCVLDMHDILWRSYARTLQPDVGLLRHWKRWALNRYKVEEERAWNRFDAVIAINRDEQRCVRTVVADDVPVFHAPMGTDLALWPYAPSPASPPRVAFYGALGGIQNQEFALRCARQILPLIWQAHPDVELWLVGSNPPDFIRRLSNDPRIRVTGFTQDVAALLGTMTAVLCPWIGMYGFRSRLIEVMALGVPVVVTPDAIHGMDLEQGRGVLVGSTDDELASHVIGLLKTSAYAQSQGWLARKQVERSFSFEQTYGRLMTDLTAWLDTRGRVRGVERGRPYGNVARIEA